MATTADRICGLLLSRSMNYAGLARAAGVTEEAARRYAKGEREPKGAALLNVAKALGTTADYLLGRTDDPLAESAGAGKISVLGRTKRPLTEEDMRRIEEIVLGRESGRGD